MARFTGDDPEKDQIHEVVLSQSYMDSGKQPALEERMIMKKWLEDPQFEGTFSGWTHVDQYGYGFRIAHSTLSFSSEKTAIMFKLRWC